jgi:hypothetical protein
MFFKNNKNLKTLSTKISKHLAQGEQSSVLTCFYLFLFSDQLTVHIRKEKMKSFPIPAIANFANLVVYPAKQKVYYNCFR